MTLEKHDILKTVRIPEIHHGLLMEDLRESSLGSLSVFIRQIVMERLKRDDMAVLVKHAEKRPETTTDSPKIGFYLTQTELTKAMSAIEVMASLARNKANEAAVALEAATKEAEELVSKAASRRTVAKAKRTAKAMLKPLTEQSKRAKLLAAEMAKGGVNALVRAILTERYPADPGKQRGK